MAELTINQLIKIIIGILVFVAVVTGIYLLVKRNVIDFFGGIPSNITELFLSLI